MMFFTLIGRAVRQRNLRQVWASTTWATMATLLLIAPLAASAQTAADFENPDPAGERSSACNHVDRKGIPCGEPGSDGRLHGDLHHHN
jgi:hypothetical protein